MPREPASESTVKDAHWRQSLRRRLLAWFAIHKRDLPWRRTRDPYRIWISEIMLQQTQVATVVPYFERFLLRFPTVALLAAAEESDVLRLWEGLGYYRRARQLHAAAKKIVTEHKGQFPQDLEAIRELPGIGRYTAAAIASIAFDLRAPILEANTARLHARLLGYHHDLTSAAGQKLLWTFAETILPKSSSGDLNQALMELGSLVCTPRSPNCDVCPVQMQCVTRARGWQSKIPAAKRKPKFEDVREAAIVIWRGDKVLLRQCAPGERWAGLWDFVRFPIITADAQDLVSELRQKTYEQVEIRIRPGKRLCTIKHGVTRFRITLDCYQARHLSGKNSQRSITLQWVTPSELENVPLNTTGRKLARMLVAKVQG